MSDNANIMTQNIGILEIESDTEKHEVRKFEGDLSTSVCI